MVWGDANELFRYHRLRMKHGRSWGVLDDIDHGLDPALPLTAGTNRKALAAARQHVFVASAIEAGCDTLYTGRICSTATRSVD